MFNTVRVAACLLVLSAAARAEDTVRPPRPVRVQAVIFASHDQAMVYPGVVQARIQAALGFRVAGKVIARDVDIGQRVTAGQVLARLDPADAQLSVEAGVQTVRAAEAEAINARADYERYQRLGRGSPAFIASEFDKRQAAVDGADARLAQAQRQLSLSRDQLDYTVLTAGADGVITGLTLETGQVVTAGQTVITLAHTDETEVVVDIPENRLPDIRAADDVRVNLWARPDVNLVGRVREIGALADSVSRTFAVKVTIPANAASLGMTASVRFSHGGGRMTAHLPASAIVSADGVSSVWVLDPAAHRAVSRPVTVAGWLGDGDVAITGGVDNGALVVTAGAALLDAATPVTAWAGAFR